MTTTTPPPVWIPTPPTPPPPASPRSQVSVFVTCAIAFGVLAAPGGYGSWAVAGVLALAAGVALSIGTTAGTWFTSTAGALYAFMAAIAASALVMGLWATGVAEPPGGVILLVGLLVLGLDWRWVDRLRPLPFASGFLVVLGVAFGDRWGLPLALVWLMAAFVSLTLLEADRRAAQPIIEPLVGEGTPRDVAPRDVATTVLVALAVGVVAALVLSTPSCQSALGRGDRSGPSQGSGSGAGQTGGSGRSGGGGQGTSEHRYVPDQDGNFLVPDDGTGAGPDGSADRIPVPNQHPELAPGERTTDTDGRGGTLEFHRRADGDLEVTVRSPGEPTKRYVYRNQPGGLTQIDQYGADGTLERTYQYDPQGKVAQGRPSTDSPTVTTPDPEPAKPSKRRELPVKEILIVLAVLASLAALGWFALRWSKRPPRPAEPPVPPWVLQLAEDLEREGRMRGCPRAGSETFLGYGRRLAAEAFPDERVAQVTGVLSDALYSRRDPGAEVQARTRATFDAMVADHPAPSRRERRREQV